MGVEDELIDLEKSGWHVLSTSDQATEIFYSHVLDQSPVMLLPGGMTLTDRDVRGARRQPLRTSRRQVEALLPPTDA